MNATTVTIIGLWVVAIFGPPPIALAMVAAVACIALAYDIFCSISERKNL